MTKPTEIVSNGPGCEPDDPRIGTLIGGRYRVLECIGLGGMGTVYRAEHTEIGRTVAIKLLRPHLLQNEEYVQRFQREARVACKLSHPNAVTAFDFGIEGDTPYLVMPFVHGRTLKSILLEQGALPLQQIALILTQVGSAIEDAHELGIVHRDLKPDNVMIRSKSGKNDWAWVLDFGIAKPLGGLNAEAPGLTRSGAFIGTPQYMSPEQALGREVDHRTDIYAIGIILYEMLTGDLPFKSSSSPVEILMQHVNEVPIPVRKFKPALNIPQGVSDAVQKALAKDPADRHESITQLVAEFKVAVDSVPPEYLRRSKRTRKFSPAVIGAGAAALVCATAAFLVVRQDTKPQQIAAVPAAVEAVQSAPLARLSPEPAAEPNSIPVKTEENEIVAVAAASAEQPAEKGQAEQENFNDPLVEEEQRRRRRAELEELSTEIERIDSASTKEKTVPVEKSAPAQPAPVIEQVKDAVPLNQEVLVPELSPAEMKQEALRLFQEGKRLLDMKDYAGATVLLEQSLGFSNMLPARLSLALSRLRQAQPDAAREQLEAALAMDQNYAPTHYNFAVYYAITGDAAQSAESLKKAIRLYPKAKKWANEDTDFDSVRTDPLIQALLK